MGYRNRLLDIEKEMEKGMAQLKAVLSLSQPDVNVLWVTLLGLNNCIAEAVSDLYQSTSSPSPVGKEARNRILDQAIVAARDYGSRVDCDACCDYHISLAIAELKE